MRLCRCILDLVRPTTTAIIRFEVMDFDRWQARHGDDLRSWGASQIVVFRDVESPNRVTAVVEWEDGASAHAVLGDGQTKARLLAAGVVGIPEVRFVQRA
jgi:hypothetical protein